MATIKQRKEELLKKMEEHVNAYNKKVEEIERLGKSNKYICVESYRNEVEKVNLLYWQLTCEAFFNTDEWKWIFKKTNYSGDYSFIFFE